VLSTCPENLTLCSASAAASPSLTRVVTKRDLPSTGATNSPRMSRLVMTTSLTLFSFRYFWKSVYGMGAIDCVATHRS
jgi:hypothetical protein